MPARRNTAASIARGWSGPASIPYSNGVSDAAMCLYHAFGAADVNLLPHQSNESIDGVYFHLAPVAPDRLDDCGARYHPALVADQELQESEFRERKANFRAFAESSECVRLKEQVARFQDVLRFGRATSAERTH